MHPPAWLLPLLILVTPVLRGDDLLADARHAQALLGPEVWSRVLRIENDAGSGNYPRTVHALVFEFAGVLWFYCGVDGTQSLSLHVGRLTEEKGNLGPLLQDIAPGFRRWKELRVEPGPVGGAGRLRNGCFIECLVLLRERLARGLETVRPALLAFYADSPTGLRGHTVLAFEDRDRACTIDPDRSGEVRPVAAWKLQAPLALAREFAGALVSRARLFPLTVPSSWSREFAAGDAVGPAAGARAALSVR